MRKLRASVAVSFLRVLTCGLIASILRAMDLRVKYVLGADLRDIRDDRALTQEQAAAEVGVSTRTWQLWENGGEVKPRAKHRRALSDWLSKTEAAA